MVDTRIQTWRRRLLATLPALAALPLLGPARAATPRQSEGPFYPRALPAERDADLTVYRGAAARGPRITVMGRVRGPDGGALRDATVEIWHCDRDGIYAHVGRPADPHFQGYGAVRTDAQGRYRFRTVEPGLYPGRTRHIHFKVIPPDGAPARALTTQMYFPGEPRNEGDFLLRGAADPAALIARRDGDALRFDIDLA